jgi:hypothetical protein
LVRSESRPGPVLEALRRALGGPGEGGGVKVIEVGSRVRIEPNPDNPSSGRFHYTGQEGQVRQVPPRDPGENVSVLVRLDSGEEISFQMSDLVEID